MNEQAVTRSVAEDGSCVTLVLQGTITIENISDLHAACVESFEDFPAIALDVSGMESADLTFMQTICSACKTAAAKDIKFTLAGQFPECVSTLSSAVGAQVGAVCHQNNNAACAWFGGVK